MATWQCHAVYFTHQFHQDRVEEREGRLMMIYITHWLKRDILWKHQHLFKKLKKYPLTHLFMSCHSFLLFLFNKCLMLYQVFNAFVFYREREREREREMLQYQVFYKIWSESAWQLMWQFMLVIFNVVSHLVIPKAS